MSKLDEIEAAVAELAPREFERFRTWFEEFQAAKFAGKIARDVQGGRLDAFAEAAAKDHRKGRTRALPSC